LRPSSSIPKGIYSNLFSQIENRVIRYVISDVVRFCGHFQRPRNRYCNQNWSGTAVPPFARVPPSDVRTRQFLSIRTIADTMQPDDFVNLRRHHEDFDTVYYGTYQDYHLSGKPSGTLRRFHSWPNGERSDSPTETRQSWAFQTASSISRRRVLAISYQATDKTLCLPFFLGPNIATATTGFEGDDRITILKDFSVEITEAKIASGSSGRTFKIRSSATRLP